VPTAATPVSQGPLAESARVVRIGKIVAAALALVLLVWWLWPTRMAPVPMKAWPAETEGTDPCEGKERCVVVIVAPWCPACKAALPIIKGMQKRFEASGRVGLKPVITSAEEPKLEWMAKQIGGQVFLDPQGTLLEKMGGGGVPHWYVVDASGKVVEQSAGVYEQLDYQLKKLGLDDL
jgi:thiol-disulfide isomerase/thioredoxin